MKKTQALLRLADKFRIKYAQDQTLKQIIESAASWGESSTLGIMNFPAQLKKDQASLRININVSNGTFGKSVNVSEPTVDPEQFSGNYAKLADQIKKYLKKHINDFYSLNIRTFFKFCLI